MNLISTTVDRDISTDNGDFIVNGEAFKNKILNILTIPIGSIPFMRSFGNNLDYYLFKPYSYSNMTLISMEIKSSILKHYREADVTVETGDLDYSTRSYAMKVTVSHPRLPNQITINKEYTSYV